MVRHLPPLVSIIIPTYNRADLLVRALESALRQTYPRLEVLIMDDASPDHTPEAIRPFLEDPRIRYHRNEKNLGLIGNWRRGFELARGTFCCFLGDDDMLAPHFVERLVHPLEQDPHAGLVFSSFVMVDHADQVLPELTARHRARLRHHTLPAGRVADLLQTVVRDWSIVISGALFRRDYLQADWFIDEITGCIDFWLVYQIIRRGYAVYFIPDPLLYLRENTASVSRNPRWRRYMLEGKTYVLERLLEDPFCAPCHPFLREELARTATSYGNTLLIEGRPPEARTVLQKALQVHPTLRTIVGYTLSFPGSMAIPVAAFLRQCSEFLALL